MSRTRIGCEGRNYPIIGGSLRFVQKPFVVGHQLAESWRIERLFSFNQRILSRIGRMPIELELGEPEVC